MFDSPPEPLCRSLAVIALLAQALHVPRITVISPICDTLRVRTTCPGIMFRRVAVSAATSVRLRIRNHLARPGAVEIV